MSTQYLKIKSGKGFTLAETLIAMAVALILLGAIVQFFLGYSRTRHFIEANFQVTNSASVIADDVTLIVRQSNRILSSRVFSGTTYTTGTSTIVLELPTVNGSGSIVAGSSDYMLFYKSGEDFYWVSTPAGSSARQAFTKRIGEAVSSVTMTYNNADVTAATKVDIDVQTTKSSGGQNYTQRVHNQAYLRNI